MGNSSGLSGNPCSSPEKLQMASGPPVRTRAAICRHASWNLRKSSSVLDRIRPRAYGSPGAYGLPNRSVLMPPSYQISLTAPLTVWSASQAMRGVSCQVLLRYQSLYWTTRPYQGQTKSPCQAVGLAYETYCTSASGKSPIAAGLAVTGFCCPCVSSLTRSARYKSSVVTVIRPVLV